MVNLCFDFYLEMPVWFHDFAIKLSDKIESIENRMKIIIELSRLNMQNNTGGPFAAGVFESETGKMISLGVNRVMSHNCSSAHAEIMAISLAQKKVESYDLGGNGLPKHDLVVNWLPCAMCYGAVIWSGIRRLIIAGEGKELEKITGFDEGPRPINWEEELIKRNIEVIKNILRKEAIEVFVEFRKSKKTVYNARQAYWKSKN